MRLVPQPNLYRGGWFRAQREQRVGYQSKNVQRHAARECELQPAMLPAEGILAAVDLVWEKERRVDDKEHADDA